ncbi:ATP-grasp domain-containing protein [Saccharothrix xinjiangensis]|uniref:Acetyl-CoA carboxylase biotin carboxylase subunit family protein n=1 Tax=Saccharothrix xinjiangensis TaxID=204798 RepID=A0ABV9YF28_9PSEU
MRTDDGLILIAHRIPAAITPLGEWLRDIAHRVVLVTSDEAAPGYADAFDRVVAVASYSTGDAVVEQLHRLCRDHDVSRIVYGTEEDVLRLARVRDRYGIPGLSGADALPYRDKLSMKERVADLLPTPRFHRPAGPADAVAFADRVGWPLVVKPRFGYGSRGVAVVRSPDALLRDIASRPDDDVLVEEFIEGSVYHVDGFMQHGEVLFSCPSAYFNDCLAFADGRPLGSWQLDPGDSFAERLSAFAVRVVGLFPATGFTPFHLEVFRRAGTDEIHFCEVAARLGGAHVFETLGAAAGINPVRTWYRRQAGLDEPVGFTPSADRFGWLLVPPRPGVLEAVDGPPLPGFVERFHVSADLPRAFGEATVSTDAVMSFVVRGANSRLLRANLSSCLEWATRAMRWRES